MVALRRMSLLVLGALIALNCTMVVASSKELNKGSQASRVAAISTISPPPPAENEPLPKPRVYLFRGALGPIFSTGMDRLAEQLTKAGIDANVYEFTICRLVADRAISKYRAAPAPIVLIGHSMGGLCSIIFADMLAKEKIPVSLVVTIDPAQASGNVPLNVERFINIFFSNGILGGGDIVAEPGYRGHYASFDLKEHKEVTHITIDKEDDIHVQLVDMITQLPRVAPQGAGDAVPLRYVVPADAKLELWDSGVRLPTHAGDTLERVAAQYHLPMWSVSQMNPVSENTPLQAGQQVVIPRHLLPAAIAPEAASPDRR